MNLQKLLVVVLIFLFIGQSFSCCCCSNVNESYKSDDGTCSSNCNYNAKLRPPCVSACSTGSFLLEINKRMFKKRLPSYY